MKYLVETNGAYSLHDLLGRQTVRAGRPSVVTPTAFIESHRGTRLTVLETLADEASDAPLARSKNEEELDAAIAALPREDKPVAKKAAPAKAATKE